MAQADAFRSLLGVDPSEPIDFPDSVELPPRIHERALEANRKSGRDRRERSIHFHHEAGQWRSGRAFRGRKMRLRPSLTSLLRFWDLSVGFRWSGSPSFFHLRWAYLFPPDIHLHTHPAIPDKVVSLVAKGLAQSDELPDSVGDQLRPIIGELLKQKLCLPSGGDVVVTLLRPVATTGHLLTSPEGNFLWVRRKPTEPTLSLPEFYREYYRGRFKGRRHAAYELISPIEADVDLTEATKFDELDLADEEVIGKFLSDSGKRSLALRVEALSSAYVCYGASSPEESTLERLSRGRDSPTPHSEASEGTA